MSLMYPHDDTPSEFDYQEDRLFKLRDILSADEIRQPNKDVNDDPMRLVLKRVRAGRPAWRLTSLSHKRGHGTGPSDGRLCSRRLPPGLNR